MGKDTFAGEWYELPGEWRTLGEAEVAAGERLRELDREQPAESSGGQDGIQDEVWIVGDGKWTRALP